MHRRNTALLSRQGQQPSEDEIEISVYLSNDDGRARETKESTLRLVGFNEVLNQKGVFQVLCKL